MKKQLLLFLLLLFSVSLSAQEKIVTSEFVHSKSTYLPGSSADLLVRFNIDPAWHINANDPGDEMAIPTEIVITPPHPGINIGRMNYPDAEYKTFTFQSMFRCMFTKASNTAALPYPLPQVSPRAIIY